MAVLDKVMDPEIPVISITDLGIVRGFGDDPPSVRLTPTYTGCPATQVIERDIRTALDAAGYRYVAVKTELSPPWTTDWISAGSGAGESAAGLSRCARRVGSTCVHRP